MKIKIKKSDILEWTAALRSGKFQQGKGSLQTVEGYCCLGVACNVFIPKHKLKFFKNVGSGKLLEGGFPQNQLAPEWLKEVNTDFENKQIKIGCGWGGGFEEAPLALSAMNDASNLFYGGFTFDEIADCLEAVYIHKVLD